MTQQTHAFAPAHPGLDADLQPMLDALTQSLRKPPATSPYKHWLLDRMLPEATAKALATLPFEAPDLHGVSGKRELHNDSRQYFDATNNARYPVCDAVSRLFQAPQTVRALQDATGADLRGTSVRIEYAVDTDCFWLQPHTDLGVKKITILYYLPDGPDQEDLGTDLYRDADTWAGRAPFAWNTALVFVPNGHTFHGFERRDIPRLRRSVIVNYVTQAWIARDQLAFPETPVSA
ncbi:MAG: uncharacterized protein JWO72_2505 [Caulobacteraceae bacterium]|nr:uncharacterized protein [Caulobacteraceae bacterium]